MTREEAIDVFEGLDELEAISLFYQRGGKADGLSIHRIKEASRMAIAALRAQQTLAKLDRSRWEGCHWCVGFCPEVTGDPHWDYRYCPICGRPLTEEARAELERRTPPL